MTGLEIAFQIYEHFYQGAIHPEQVVTRYRDAYLLYQELQQNYNPKVAYQLLITAWNVAIEDAHNNFPELNGTIDRN